MGTRDFALTLRHAEDILIGIGVTIETVFSTSTAEAEAEADPMELVGVSPLQLVKVRDKSEILVKAMRMSNPETVKTNIQGFWAEDKPFAERQCQVDGRRRPVVPPGS